MLPVFLNVPLWSILPVITAVEPLPPDTAKPPEHVVKPVTLRLPCTVFCGQVILVLPLALADEPVSLALRLLREARAQPLSRASQPLVT